MVAAAAHKASTRPRPLLDSRGVAIKALAAVLDRGRALDEAFETVVAAATLESRDRAFARLLVTTVLRRLGQIDDALSRVVDSKLPLRPPAVMNLLRLGAAQLMFLDTPAHAAVDTTVTLAEDTGLRRAKGLANAVMRRLAREGAEIASRQDAARLNTPDWLWSRWAARYGEAATRAVAEQHLREPPLDLTLKPDVDPAALCAALGATCLPTGTARRALGGRIEDLPRFTDGAWWVQDAAAALPARLFGDLAGATVYDLCAAPGGKTAQLAAAGAIVTAVDRSPQRLELVVRNLNRLKLTANCVAADALAWKPPAGKLADAVLLDAPCSATGTARRHPDVPRVKTAEDIAKLGRLQNALLERAAGLLRPGGLLVYCTCSLEPEEGEFQVGDFLARDPGMARVPVEPAEIGGLADLIDVNGDIRALPSHLSDRGGMDGFFVSRLRRKT